MTAQAITTQAGPRPMRTPLGGVLTPRSEWWIRMASLGSAAVIALSAMVLSYAGLHDLALDAQVPARLALLVPIMVDGLQFVGSLGVVYSTLSGLRTWYPWMLMLGGVSISAWGNWQAAPDDLTSRLLHAAAPVILALVLEELLRVMRHKVQLHAAAWEAEQVDDQVATTEPVAPPVVEPVVEQPVVEPVAPPVVEPVVEQPVAPPVEPQVVPPAAEPQVAEPQVVEQSVVEPVAPPAVEQPVAPPAAEPQVAEPVAPPAAEQPVERRSATVGASADDDADDDDAGFPDYPEDAIFKDQVRAILTADPDMTAPRIVRHFKSRGQRKDPSYTRSLIRDFKAEQEQEQKQATAPSRQADSTRPSNVSPLRGLDPFAASGAAIRYGRDDAAAR